MLEVNYVEERMFLLQCVELTARPSTHVFTFLMVTDFDDYKVNFYWAYFHNIQKTQKQHFSQYYSSLSPAHKDTCAVNVWQHLRKS